MESGHEDEMQLRKTAKDVMSLNLDDLDMKELERRLDIVQSLRELSTRPTMRPSACPDLDCGRFRCGTFRELV